MFIFSKRCKFVQTRKYPKHLSIKTISKIASTVVGLAAIAYLLNCLWSMKGSGHIVPFSIFHKTVDESCFFFEDAKATKLEAISDRSIFLVASACELLDLRKICTVESAANTHPDWTIHIILYGHVKGNRNSKYYYTFLSKLEAYQNVLITSIDLREYFIGTPLEPLLTLESLKEIQFPEYFVSDLVKIATLYNHGGVYLSWAVVVERSLRTLSNDFFVQEPGKKVSSTILRLSNSEVRKEVINKIISVINKNFKMLIKKRDLLGNALHEVCGCTIANKTCSDIPIYDKEYFPSTYDYGSEPYVNIAGIVPYFNSLSQKAKFIHTVKKFCPHTMLLLYKSTYLRQPRWNSSTNKRSQIAHPQTTQHALHHS